MQTLHWMQILTCADRYILRFVLWPLLEQNMQVQTLHRIHVEPVRRYIYGFVLWPHLEQHMQMQTYYVCRLTGPSGSRPVGRASAQLLFGDIHVFSQLCICACSGRQCTSKRCILTLGSFQVLGSIAKLATSLPVKSWFWGVPLICVLPRTHSPSPLGPWSNM